MRECDAVLSRFSIDIDSRVIQSLIELPIGVWWSWEETKDVAEDSVQRGSPDVKVVEEHGDQEVEKVVYESV